jgi:hypothetical protein
MNRKSILAFFFIVLIIYVTLTPYSVSYHKRCILENFEEQPIEFGVLNRYTQRPLAFKPPHSRSRASQRSENENNIAFDSTANCTTTSIPNNINPNAQSLVTENDILYKLTSACFAFKTQPKPETGFQDNELLLNIKSSQDWFKYVYFMLLNPLFIEINKDNHTTTSVAYYPSYRTFQPITNKGHGDFSTQSPNYDGTVINLQKVTGPLFNYADNKTYQNIEKLNINEDNINIKAYYARPHDTTQTVGTIIKYTNKPSNGRYRVTRSAYDKLHKNNTYRAISATIDKYFNSLSRNTYPTFTTTFKLNLSANSSANLNNYGDTQFMIFEMFMNNTFGINNNCNTNVVYQPQFAKNGNMFSMTMQYPKNNNNLIKLKMGTSIGGCLFRGGSIELSLPYFQNTNTEATCILTFSPFTIDFLAYWVNPNLDKKNNFEFIYQQNVSYSVGRSSSDFHRLFIGVPTNPNIKLGDVMINTDTSTIPMINEVILGHKNMAEILYKAIHEGQ